MFSESQKLSKFQMGVLIVLGGFFIFSFTLGVEVDPYLHVYFLDVGQGDAILIKYQDKHVLVDGGPDRSVVNRLSEVLPFSEREIDMVIATHSDSDHISGLIDVLRRYEVKRILETGMVCDTSECKEWESVKKEEGAPIYAAQLGQKLVLGDDVELIVLYPLESIANEEVKNKNAYSVVTRLRYGEISFLLTGDIERASEEKLVYSDINLDVDVLKLGHHGSKTSSTEVFLEATSPSAAVIQSGKDNRYGHPSFEVLDRLAKFAIPYYRTDTLGTIEIVSDGKSIAISGSQ